MPGLMKSNNYHPLNKSYMEAEQLKKTQQQPFTLKAMYHPYLVQVVERSTRKISYEVKCKSFEGADKIQDGLENNINHEKYYTRLVLNKGS